MGHGLPRKRRYIAGEDRYFRYVATLQERIYQSNQYYSELWNRKVPDCRRTRKELIFIPLQSQRTSRGHRG